MKDVIHFFFAAILGFAAVVEMSHFRFYLKRKRYERMVFTLTASIATAYMASESLDGTWPSWGDD